MNSVKRYRHQDTASQMACLLGYACKQEVHVDLHGYEVRHRTYTSRPMASERLCFAFIAVFMVAGR